MPPSPPPTEERFGAPRSKTISWHDPLAVARAGAEMAGLDYLRAMIAGELPHPPITAHFGLRGTHVEEGSVRFEARPDESTYNPIGLVHGGFVCTALDSAAGCAVHTTLPAGTGYTSIDIKVEYLRPVRPVGEGEAPLEVLGRVVKPGRRVAYAEAQLLDAGGRLLATATSACLVVAP